MIKYLIKTVNEIRVATEEEADALHQEIAEKASRVGAVLTNWTETKKERKSQGEVIEEWYICKYTYVFNDPKEPITPFDDIQYVFTQENVSF